MSDITFDKDSFSTLLIYNDEAETIHSGSQISFDLDGSLNITTNQITSEITGSIKVKNSVLDDDLPSISGSISVNATESYISGSVTPIVIHTTDISGLLEIPDTLSIELSGTFEVNKVETEINGTTDIAIPVDSQEIIGEVAVNKVESDIDGVFAVARHHNKDLRGLITVPNYLYADLLTGTFEVNKVEVDLPGSFIVTPAKTEYITGDISIISDIGYEVAGKLLIVDEFSEFLLTGEFAVNQLNTYIVGKVSVSLVDETFIEFENEYSAIKEMKFTGERMRKNSFSEISANQLGLIPTLYSDFHWKQDVWYFKNGKDTVSREYYTTYVQIRGILNRFIFEDPEEKYFDTNMLELFEKKKIIPFLLFIDQKFIPWSKYDIIRSDNYYTIRLLDRDKDIKIGHIDIMKLPFHTIYSEDGNQALNNLFSFNEKGLYDARGQYCIGTDDPNVKMMYYHDKNLGKFDTGIDPNKRMFKHNFFFFDEQNGIIRKDNVSPEVVSVYNRNLVTVDVGRSPLYNIIAIWDNRSLDNKAVSMRAKHNSYVKSAIKEDIYVPNLPPEYLIREFECAHNPKLAYSKNIENTMNYIFNEDHNHYDWIYEKYNDVDVVEFTQDQLEKGRKGNTYTLNRFVDTTHNRETYPIIFKDGLADPDINNSIRYTGPGTFSFTGDLSKSKVVIVFFKYVVNGKYRAAINNSKIDVHSCFIPKEDMVAMVQPMSNGYLCPVNTTVTMDKNELMLQEPGYLTKPLYIVSKRQFIHSQFKPITNTGLSSTAKIVLDSNFETAYDRNRYMVFVDGKHLNPIYYTITVPTIKNFTEIKEHAIYFKFNIIGKTIDVYYCNNRKNAEYIGDFLIECRDYNVDYDGQIRFKVPYPYKSYPRDYDSFFVIKNTLYVDKSRYIIDGDYIEFDSRYESFKEDQIVTFVFPYYRPEWDTDGDITPAESVNFYYYRKRVPTDTKVVTVDTAPASIKGARYVFMNTTFISPERYTINGNVLTFNETIPANSMITIVCESNANVVTDNKIELNVTRLTATTDPQYVFNVPDPNYLDAFFVVKGTVLVSPERYTITTNGKLIFDPGDPVTGNESLYFLTAKNIDENPTNRGMNTMHIKLGMIKFTVPKKSTSVKVPMNYYYHLKLNPSNCLVWSNSTFYNSDRFSIDNNTITLEPGAGSFSAGREVIVFFAYKVMDKSNMTNDFDYHDFIRFEDVDVSIRNGATSYYIPYPNRPFTDTEFFITIGNRFIPESHYEKTGNGTIKFAYPAKDFTSGHKIRFTFIHNDDFTHISKSEASVEVTAANQEILDIPSPFRERVNLDRRMLVIYNGTYLNHNLYRVDNINRKLEFINGFKPEINHDISFIFFIAGPHSINYIPESGYFALREKTVNRNFNNNMLLVFLNGKLIPKSEIMPISNTIYKITKDHQSRYDLVLYANSPLITEMKNWYTKPDSWTKMIKDIPITK